MTKQEYDLAVKGLCYGNSVLFEVFGIMFATSNDNVWAITLLAMSICWFLFGRYGV